jgi:hypothetical protein
MNSMISEQELTDDIDQAVSKISDAMGDLTKKYPVFEFELIYTEQQFSFGVLGSYSIKTTLKKR